MTIKDVIIDGVRYVPVAEAARSGNPDLRRALVEVWLGEGYPDGEINQCARTLRVRVTDTDFTNDDPTIDEFVAGLKI